ncbi:hypothetical protein DMR_36250 [Solidesulfovibrio magneticus RS-1]|uniref:Uncharacterized protein n=1 Tax=Solidesulfovibrio magneticus (strain ATCC 700980 / DSM 13731 / RS-1) TaxID=573370 RepID=C4XLH8_SOLM1|nr:hypothetical protein DMR_36250 [Solidesulfovibrio magneticus RS-1]
MFGQRRIGYFTLLACSHNLYAKCLYEVDRIKFDNNATIQSRLHGFSKNQLQANLNIPENCKSRLGFN